VDEFEGVIDDSLCDFKDLFTKVRTEDEGDEHALDFGADLVTLLLLLHFTGFSLSEWDDDEDIDEEKHELGDDKIEEDGDDADVDKEDGEAEDAHGVRAATTVAAAFIFMLLLVWDFALDDPLLLYRHAGANVKRYSM